MSDAHDHAHLHHHHGAHGHPHDRGWRGAARYLRSLRRMWTSPVNREVISRLDIHPDERVLDIGAGMGPGSVLAAQTGARVVAVEPTPLLRRILRARRLLQPARQRIEVHDGTAEQLPVADAHVDAAWTVNTMHHWSDLAAAIPELRRVLRQGGRVLLADEDFDDPNHPDHQRISERRRAHHVEFPQIDPVEVGAQLAAAGFVVEHAGTTCLAGRPTKLIQAKKA
jgi:SAM-dependent methyltransferase